MITTFFLSIPVLFLNIFSLILPIGSISSTLSSALTSAGADLYSLNAFIPVSTFAIVVGILLSTEIYILIFKTARWLASYIPWFGGRGV